MHDRNPEGMTAEARAMPSYISHKRVWALEIDDIERAPDLLEYRLTFRDAGYAPIYAPAAMWSRYQPVPGDFYVVYADGYKSFSPRKAFLEGYIREPAGRQHVG